MEIFRKTMDFFQKNSHVFRISWEIIEGTREKRQKQKGRRNIHKGIHGKNKRIPWQKQKRFHGRNKRNPRQKQIHDKNQKDSMAETKTNSQQKQKQIHGRNKKDSTQNRKERRAIRA